MPFCVPVPRLTGPDITIPSSVIVSHSTISQMCSLNNFCVINAWRLRNLKLCEGVNGMVSLGTPALECVSPSSSPGWERNHWGQHLLLAHSTH